MSFYHIPTHSPSALAVAVTLLGASLVVVLFLVSDVEDSWVKMWENYLASLQITVIINGKILQVTKAKIFHWMSFIRSMQVTVFSFSKPKEQKHPGNTLVKLHVTTCTMLHGKNKTPMNLKCSHILYLQYILPLCLKHQHLAWQWMHLSNHILIR